MQDDRILMERYGKKQPFTTPEGYFEHFHEQLMSSLPEVEPIAAPTTKISIMTRVKPWLYMAAMFVGIIFMVEGLMYVQQKHLPASDIAIIAEEVYTEEADHFMSSSLYSEYVLYSYLTTNEYE